MDGASGEDLALSVTQEPDASDQVIEQQGARVFVQETLAGILDHMSLDASIVEDQVSFTLGEPGDGAR